MVKGIEPYRPRELADWLKQQGCLLISQSGAHCFWLTKDGATVGIPDHRSRTPHPVTTVNASAVARAFNLTLHDLRSALGYGAGGKSSATRKRRDRVVRGNTPTPLPSTPVDELAQRGIVELNAIYRSGPCRKTSPADRRVLEGIISRLTEWRTMAEGA